MRDRLRLHSSAPELSLQGTLAAPRPHAAPGGRTLSPVRSLRLPAPELAALMALAAALNLWALARNGWANEYYSAAVRSMGSSWHNFLYGAFDPSGLMTVDKPPLALWVQALSARVFGYHPLSVLVPQALMGVAAVALVYDLTRRRFGRVAGGVAGLVLALTPIAVAISRHNNPDALLVLCCVAALWCVVRGLEDGRTRWLVLAGVCVGLGFEAKMAVALMVVPGVAVAWLWVAPRGRVTAVRQLLAGGAAMVVVGGAWPLLIALTPSADRPWVSGTGDNSIWSLIWGYNGLGRLDGQAGGPGGGSPGGNSGPFGGSAGIFRLFNEALGGQAGWLLGFAVVAAFGLAVASRMRRDDARSGWLLSVGGAFATTAIAFSFAKGIFHPYYVSLLAPFTASLVGAGAGELVRGEVRARMYGPLALLAGGATEIAVLHGNGDMGWLPPVLALVLVPVAAALAAGAGAASRGGLLATGLAVLLIAPASWSVQTLGHTLSGTFPAGGPASAASGGGGPGGGGPGGGGPTAGARGFGPPGMAPGGPGATGSSAIPAPQGMPSTTSGAVPTPPGATTGGPAGGFAGAPASGEGGGPFGGNTAAITAAVRYANAHGGGTIAVASQQGASAAIISSGADVAGIGGFSGRESQVSVAWLADAVRAGKVRWVIADGGGLGMRNDGRVGSTTAMDAVAQTCKAVTTSAGTLYDCQGKADALARLG